MSDQSVSPVQDCQKGNPLDNTPNPSCNYSAITISKGEDRKLILNEKTPPNQNYLSIVCGRKNKKATVKSVLEIPVGPCKTDHSQRVWFNSFGAKPSSDKEIKFDAASQVPAGITSIGSVSPFIYNLQANTCGKKYSFDIKAFPDTRVDLFFKIFDMGETKTTKVNSNYKSKCKKKYETNKSYFEVNYTYEDDGKPLELDISITSLCEKISKCFDIADTLLGVLKNGINRRDNKGFLIQTDYSSITIKKPAVEIGGSWYWKEIKGSPDCEFVKSISIAASPLIEATGSLNITNIIIAAFTSGAAVKLFHLSSSALDKLNAKITVLQLILSITGSIEGNVDYDFANKKTPWSGKVVGKVTLSLNLDIIDIEFEKFLISVDVALSITAETSVEGSITYDQHDSSLAGTLDWKGFSAYITAKAEFKVSSKKKGGGMGAEDKFPIFDEVGATNIWNDEWNF